MEVKNSLSELNRRFEEAKERISKPEAKFIETIQCEY
jgi:hypothetical protein